MDTTLGKLKNFFSSFRLLLSFGVIAAVATYFFISKAYSEKSTRIDAAFANYISAYTSGAISRQSEVRIQLAGNFADSAKIGQETDLFSFSPDIEGKAYWLDASTIAFKPASPLPSGTHYEASFNLSNLLEVPDDLETFEFKFEVIQQSFEVTQPSIETIDLQTLTYQRVSGTLLTADTEEKTKVEALLRATYEAQPCRIKWQHAADDKTHRYTIDSVVRKQSATTLTISWDGDPLGLDLTGKHELNIPALGDFSVVSVNLEQDDEPYVSIFFSDPILPTQDLNGLITIDNNLPNNMELRFTISGNEVKCYPGTQLSGQHVVNINPGIKNILGLPLPAGRNETITFADLKPAVTLVGKGVIMPASKHIVVPFEAVSLKAVDITITRIYENNIAQFLQVNQLSGSYELKRVGRPVLRKTIALDKDKLADLRKPNRFAINLDELIKTEPGAIYNIKFSFRKSYSLYRCNGDTSSTLEEEEDANMTQLARENWDDNGDGNESSYWDYADEYYDEDFRWNERDNPCHSSYFNGARWVSRNVLASDLGLIAKAGTTGEYFFSVTDLITTKPIAGVVLDVLDYQQQRITSLKTDANGWTRIGNLPRKPYLVVARKGTQRGYLRVDDGSSLSLSRFDVSGDVVQKGLKGFIYGERGVWRPGDSIYLTFILDDRNQSLPPAYPVTLELSNPQGVLYQRLVQTKSLNGFYSFHTATPADAPTGNWLARVKAGGAQFSKNLRIETVMPNRLKINFDFGTKLLQKSQAVQTTLESRWLHGAIASNLDAQVDVSLTPIPTTFPRYSEFAFDDPTRKFSSESKTIFQGKLNADGKATVKADIETESQSAGMLRANFVTKVFEAGGGFSVDRFQVNYSPYSSYVGVRLPKGDKERNMLLTDTNHTVQLSLVDPNGNPVKGARKVKVILYKISWRWWWDKSNEDLSNFSESENYQTLQEGEATIVNGVGRWTLRVNYPDWGRYLLRVVDESGGHSTGKIMYIDWPGWAMRAQNDNPQEATMLTFTTDKKTYRVGEKITVTIPSSEGGRALISVESGSNQLATYWAETQRKETRFTFPVTANMLPNVYVHITLIQPHAQTLNDLPIRLYGMVPVTIEDPATHLKPQVHMPAQLRPEEPFKLTVSEATGQPMTYTIAIVDEGLLDLTRFKTPDPHPHFYAREALGVKTWDMFDEVMGAFAMQMNRILSVGGDEGLNRKSQDGKANRFKPVVRFIGPFYANAGQQQTHQLTLPQYVGAVRVMVVAGHKGAYGFAEKSVPVKKPLMVMATLPRVLGPEETVKLPVTVFAMEKNIRNVQVQVTSNNLIQITGSHKQTLSFSKPGEGYAEFTCKIKQGLGVAKVSVVASSGGEKARYDVELDVRNPNPYITQITPANIEAGSTWSTSLKPVGIKGTNQAILEVSSIPPVNLSKRLDYLIQYPYGCVEQTVSAVFPQLALRDIMELSPERKATIEKNIRNGINRLRGYQRSDGGLSYWPGMGNADDWGSTYAGHFMLEAEAFGYTLPVGFINAWKTYQRKQALAWTLNAYGANDLVQAYRLYTLALAKAPELGAMNRLKELDNRISPAARWRLAAAYVLTGQKEVAQELIRNMPIDIPPYLQSGFTYGSDLRDEAMILETLVLLDDRTRAYQVMHSLCKQLSSDVWLSTQTTAQALIAIAKLSGRFNTEQELVFAYTLNGRTQNHRSKTRVVQYPLTADVVGKISVNNTGKQLLYTRVVQKGQPALGAATDVSNNLNLTVQYKDMAGNNLDPTRILQGTDFKMEVTITNPGNLGMYEQMALSQVFPSGWEIHNTRMDGNEQLLQRYAQPTYQNVRDDRVYTFFNIGPKQSQTFVVLLNASYCGRFYLPPVLCEAMYNGNVSASKGGRWVEVISKQQKAKTLVAAK